MAKVTKRAVVTALQEEHGNISAAARRLGVTRRAVSRWIDKDDVLKRAVTDARETMIDCAEQSLARAVEQGEAWAVCFTLKCLGKRRGYVERVPLELSGPDGAPIQQQAGLVAAVDLGARLDTATERVRQIALRQFRERAVLPAPETEQNGGQ